MVWIRVTAIPTDEHLDTPRASFLLDTATVVAFEQRPGCRVNIWMDWNPDHVTIQIAESLEDIQESITVATHLERMDTSRPTDVLEHIVRVENGGWMT